MTTDKAASAAWPAPGTRMVLRLAAWLLRHHSRAGRWQPVEGEDWLNYVATARCERRLQESIEGRWPSSHLTDAHGVCLTRGHYHP
jgi:hypothetical protein